MAKSNEKRGIIILHMWDEHPGRVDVEMVTNVFSKSGNYLTRDYVEDFKGVDIRTMANWVAQGWNLKSETHHDPHYPTERHQKLGYLYKRGYENSIRYKLL